MQRVVPPPGGKPRQKRRGHRQRLDPVEESVSDVVDTIREQRR
jgi:hypothetical protein